MSTYNNPQILTALNAIMDLGLDKKHYQSKDLNIKIKKIKPRRSIQHFFQRGKKWLKPCKYIVLSHFSTIQLLKIGLDYITIITDRTIYQNFNFSLINKQ